MSNKNETTVKGLFSRENIRFEIPSYQRAYSWETEQIQQFIEDLKNVKRHYYFGNFLFEKKKDDHDALLVIDGQQRLTTTVIFFSAVHKYLSEQPDSDNNKRIISDIENTYLLETGFRQYRFSTVKADRELFNDLISKRTKESLHEINSASQKRIVNAKKLLDNAVKSRTAEEILSWKTTLEDADITTYQVPDKKRATQIFSFQNDRGKDLSLLEKIKAYFMLQTYLEFEDEKDAEPVIEFIEEKFSKIYANTEETGLKENDALRAFWRAFGGRGFHTENLLKEIKEDLNKSSSKIDWIEQKMLELTRTFEILKVLQKSRKSIPALNDLYTLNNLSISLPFLIRAKTGKFSVESFERFVRVLEILTFRHIVSGGKAQIRTRLHKRLMHMTELDKKNEGEKIIGDIIHHATTNGWWWKWNDNSLKNKLSEDFYSSRGKNYLLWKYEQTLSSSGYGSGTSRKSIINGS